MATTYTHIAANKRKSFLLVVAFVAFLLLLGYVVDRAFEGGTSFLVIALVVSCIMTLVGYFRGDRIALWTAGAREISKEANPYVYNLVENLTITAGLPMPRVYLIEDAAMNAFATGRDPAHGSIALTTGIVAGLENEELEGVIAHELSHIGNYDVRLMMLVAVLVGILVLFSDFFLRASFFGGMGRRRSSSGGGGLLAIVGLVLIILSPIIAQLMKLAVSRKRELLADASGALLTRYPEGLARALEKIERSGQPVRRATNATAHLYFTNPFGAAGRSLSRLFATHPPIPERILALRAMAGGAQ